MFCFSSGAVFSQQPDEFQSLLASAQQAQVRGDFEGAAGFYRQAVALRPNVAELRANLGLMYYQTGRDADAVEAFRQALRSNAALFVPNLFIGLEYVKLKQPGRAVSYLQRAAHLKSTDIQTSLALGQAYADLGERRNAIASYSRVVQLDANNADGWFHLGMSYLEQVEADARLLSSRYKDSGYLRALTAESLFQQREFARAADQYRAALSSRTFPPETHAEFGFVLLDQQRLTDAKREFKAEFANSPDSLMAKLGMARLLLEQGQTADGLNRLEDVWKRQPAFLKRHIALLNTGAQSERAADLGRVLDEQVDAGTISPELASMMRSAPDEGSITADASPSIMPPTNVPMAENKLFQRAEEQYAAGNYDQCTDLLVPRLQLLHTRQLGMLASCAYSVGDYKTAFKAAQKLSINVETQVSGLYWETKSAQKLATESLVRAGEIDAASPRMHVLLGDVYREKNYFPQAEKEYRKALELRPSDSGAMFGLCLVLLGDLKADEAFQLAQENLKQRPQDPELNAVMGELLCTRQDFSAAEPYLKRGLNSSPELAAHVHALLGKVYAETNRTDQGIAELKLALDHDRDGHIHYQIARLYLKVGDRQSAQAAFDTSARLRNEEAKRAALGFENGADETEPQY